MRTLKFKKITRKFLLIFLLLLSTSFCAYAQQFMAARPSEITNSSPERFYNAETFTVRSFTNPVIFSCYSHVISTETGNILIDCGYYDTDIKDYIKSIGGVNAVLLSHCHVDHIVGLNALKKDHPDMKVYIHSLDLGGLYDVYVNYSFERLISEPFIIDFEVLPLEEGEYNFAGSKVKVISSAGHSPGSVLYYFEDKGLLFLGDSLAFGGLPRYDLKNSNVPALFESVMRLKHLGIPADTRVFFGHGEHISYGDMLKNFNCFNKNLSLSIKTPDGNIKPVEDFYFDGDTLMIALQEAAKYFYDAKTGTAVLYMPDMSRLKVKAGSPEAEFNDFIINMKSPAQLRDEKIYLSGKFIAEIFKPFIKWELK